MIPIQIVRVVCVVLFLLALAFAAKLMLQHEAPLAAKVGWIAAVLLVIALAPEKLPFFSRDAGTSLFFRNVFGGIFVALLLLDLFVIFWIQLPQEQVPRFDGRVVELVSLQGVVIPRLQFQDDMGKPTVFDDALAPTIFPRHTFFVSERLVVRAPATALPHIDHSALARWDTAIFLILIAALTFSLSLACHLRYLSLTSRA